MWLPSPQTKQKRITYNQLASLLDRKEMHKKLY